MSINCMKYELHVYPLMTHDVIVVTHCPSDKVVSGRMWDIIRVGTVSTAAEWAYGPGSVAGGGMLGLESRAGNESLAKFSQSRRAFSWLKTY